MILIFEAALIIFLFAESEVQLFFLYDLRKILKASGLCSKLASQQLIPIDADSLITGDPFQG